MIRIAGIMLALVVLAGACEKDTQKPETPFSGSITINTPAENAVVSGGTSFPITAQISGNKEMHGYLLTIYNESDQSVVFTSHDLDHATAYTINEVATHNLTAATALRLVIDVEVDHDGQTLQRELLFTYQP